MGSRRGSSWRVALGVALVLLLALPSQAEPPPSVDPLSLSLDEAIALALDHAPTLQDARAKVALARLDVRATQWWTWLIPTVSAHQGYDFLAGQERAAVALSVDLSKFLGKGAREAEQASLGLEHAQRALDVARDAVITEVTKAVFHVTATGATAQVREEAVAHALKLQALETIKFEHGTGDLAPLLHAQAALARARLDLLTTQQATRLAELALLRAIGLPLP